MSGAGHYYLWFYQNGNCSGNATTHGTPNTSYQVTGLLPGTTYSAKVKACRTGNTDCSDLSSCVAGTTTYKYKDSGYVVEGTFTATKTGKDSVDSVPESDGVDPQ